MNSVRFNPFNQQAAQQLQKKPQAQPQQAKPTFNAGSATQGGHSAQQPGKTQFNQFQKPGQNQGSHGLDPSKSVGKTHQVNKTNTQNDLSEQQKTLASSQIQGVGQRLNLMG